MSWPALVAGAAFAWNPADAAAPGALPLAALLGRWMNGGQAAATGAALVALGNVHRELVVRPVNASALFKIVMFAHRSLQEAGLERLTEDDLERAAAATAAALGGLEPPPSAAPGLALVQRELGWAAAMLDFGCRLGRARVRAGADVPLQGLPRAERRRLARDLGCRIAELDPIWLARSRPGGLDDSRRRLQRLQGLLS